MGRSKVKDLTVGSPFRLIIGFTGPLIFGMLLQQLYNFVDTAIVGRFLGTEALAAVGSTGSVNFLILGFCIGLCSGLSIPIAQAFGAKDETEMRRCVIHSAYISGAVSVILGLVTGLLCPQLLQLMNTPEEIIQDATTYIQLIFFAMPASALYNMTAGVMRSLGDSKTPVVFLAVAALMNIVLDLLFIIVFRMGVFGASLATVISQLLSGAGCLLVLVFRYPMLRMSREDLRFRPIYARRMLGMGLPFGLQYSITAIGSVMMQAAVNGLGTMAVAAMTSCVKLFNFFTSPIDSLSSTMATFAGQNVGAKRLERIGNGLKASITAGVVYCGLVLAAICFAGEMLIGLFVSADESQVIALAKQYLLVIGISFPLLLLVNLVRFTIQGMGFTRVAMISGMMEMIARVLVATVVIPLFGFDGACFGNPAAWLFADTFLIPCYFVSIKRLRARLQWTA